MAGAFNQMKDLYKMQKEARQMQKKMKKVRVTGMSDDELVHVTINGTQELEEVEVDDQLLDIHRKKDLLRGFKQAMKDSQKRLQKEMMKDMDMDKLKGMLGG
ncbi:MAG: YbaB/EbfC family nucleoid-associated protein [Candidatus Dojkabacteria bacterium]